MLLMEYNNRRRFKERKLTTQADALELLVQAFGEHHTFLSLGRDDRSPGEVKRLFRPNAALALLVHLKDTAADSETTLCYRPSVYTRRLLHKLQLIQTQQIQSKTS